MISIRGNWPLFPARDVVVPHTRTMPDMLRILDVLVQDDPITRGDFWRRQDVVEVPAASSRRPPSYLGLTDPNALQGRRLAVPAMYLGLDPDYPMAVRESVLAGWERARSRLKDLGAEVIVSDFPLISAFEAERPGQKFIGKLGDLPPEWSQIEFGSFLAFGWDDFLRANGDPSIPDLRAVESREIYPPAPGALPDRYERLGDQSARFADTVDSARAGLEDPRSHPLFACGLRALVALREELVYAWMRERGFDALVLPANADVDEAAADLAWANGVVFSHGNYALRQVGLPTVTVPMGIMDDTRIPVGLTFAGPSGSDAALLGWAAAFDAESMRQPPALEV